MSTTTTTTDPSQPAGWPTQPPRRRRGRKVVLAIAAGIAGLFLIGAIFGNSDQGSTTKPKTTSAAKAAEPKDDGISQGLGSAGATADVKLVGIDQPDAIGIRYGHLAITNHSEGTSDYYVELRILDGSGVNLGMTNATADRVEPGQSAKAEFMVTEDGAAKVEVTEVQRTASS
jgi:hypothetical protein